ncbi:MAG: head decoration protein, partial [Lentibacter algarum]|nr:head decoration protein [Lentibacter algarum]
MANTIQFKRRSTGNAGAPAALKSGEVAHNEVENTLYVGKGDDGAGNATAIVPLAGTGAFV